MRCRIVTDDFIHVRRALRAAKTVEDVKRLASQLLLELETYLGKDESVEPKPKPKPEPEPKPKQIKRAIAAVERETVAVAAPPPAPSPPAFTREAIWRKLCRFEFAFSEDKTEDAELRILLLEAYDKKYTCCSTFCTVFDILLHTMDADKLPVSLARCMADRCLS